MAKKLSRLEPVELREVWPDEAQNFTPWLAEEENLILLGKTLYHINATILVYIF